MVPVAYFLVHVPRYRDGTTSTILLASIQPSGENSDIAVEFAYSPWNRAGSLKSVMSCRKRMVHSTRKAGFKSMAQSSERGYHKSRILCLVPFRHTPAKSRVSNGSRPYICSPWPPPQGSSLLIVECLFYH